MNHQDAIALLRSGRLTRRQTLQLLASAGVIAVSTPLASCQGEGKRSAMEGSVDLSILEWSGYQQEEYHPEFNAKYGGQPAVALFAEEEDALQRMRNGYQVDVVHFCANKVQAARDSGLIRPLDTDRIPRWKDVTPELLEINGVRGDGEYWLAPWDWGYSTVAYNPETIDIENATYEMFIDPRFKGRTALTSSITVNFIIAGVIGGWTNPVDPTPEEVESAGEIFTKMLENARFIWTDSTQLEQAWAAGDVGISYVFGSATRRMRKQGMPNIVVPPLMTWLCGLCISANGAGSEEQAYDYINAMLDPISGLALFNKYGYGHGNASTKDLIDPELITGTGIDNPGDMFASGIYTDAVPPAKNARLFQLWFEAQAGLD